MWFHHIHAFQDSFDDCLAGSFCVGGGEEVEEKIAEEVGVGVGVAELVYQAAHKLMQAVT